MIWVPSAQDELARIWLQATDRQAVTRASARIDFWLQRSPLSVGQPSGGKYQLIIKPLKVVYAVFPDDCQVHVLQVFVAN